MATRVNVADRATLGVWRTTNLIGWPLLALFLSFFLRLGFEAAADLYGHALGTIFDWPSFGEYSLFVPIPSALLCGCLIGSMIGDRVFWRPPVTAMVVGAVFAFWSWRIVISVYSPYPPSMRVISAAFAALTVPIAGVIAQRIGRRRPRLSRLLMA